MNKLHKGRFLKLCEVFGLSLILSSAVYSVVAEESNFHRFPTGEQEGGGVRGVKASCKADADYPIPLIPQDNQTVTALASPKLYFDVSAIEEPVALDFLMLDKNDEIVYQNVLEADRQSNLVSLELSPSSSGDRLEMDNAYHWYLVENCGDRSTPNIIAAGSLRRIELQTEFAQKLAKASRVEKINLYQEANMWHEAVENIAQLSCKFTEVSLADRITAAVDTTSQLIDPAEGNLCLVTK